MRTKPIIAATLLALVGGNAFAADLPAYKAPPMAPPPPPPLWTGFYLGANAGYTWSSSNTIAVAAFPGSCNSLGAGCVVAPNFSSTSALLSSFTTSASNDGFIGGGQIGYNWQTYGNFVIGLEADIQGIAGSTRAATIASSAENPNFAGLGFPINNFATASRSVDYLGTVRGRVGWLFTPTLLLYGTGGLAYGGVSANVSMAQQVLNDPGIPNAYFGGIAYGDTRVGWTAGGGLEWMFWPNWSAKIEYLYYDLGTLRVATSPLVNLDVTGATFSSAFPAVSTRFDGHIVRAGLNYHLNWGASAPVIAKY